MVKAYGWVLALMLAGGCSHTNSQTGGAAKSTVDETALFTQAQSHALDALRAGKLSAARDAWLRAHRLRPNDAHTLSNLGLVEDMLGRHEDAVAHVARAAQLQPQSPALAVNYGLVLERNGMEGQGVGEYRRALEIDPKFEPALVALGARALLQGQVREAERHFQDAIRFHPARPDAYAGLAAVAAAREEWAKAAELMHRASVLRETDAVMTAAAGALYYRAGDTAMAINALDRALALDPRLGDALVLRAEVAWLARDYAGAEALLKRAVEADEPGEARAGSLLRRGELAFALDKPDIAARTLQGVLRQDEKPDAWRGRAHVVLGTLSVRRHDYPTALREFKAAKAALGETAAVTAGLAGSLHGIALTGPMEKRTAGLQTAEKWYRQSLQSAENPRLRVSLARLYLELADMAQAPYRRGKYRQAELQLQEALKHEPGLVEAHVRLGMLLEVLGRMPEARASFETALRLDPASSRLHFLYANMLRRVAEKSADEAARNLASRHFRQAMKLDPTYVPAQVGWYLTTVTGASQTLPAEAQGGVTEETIVPFGEGFTEETPPATLEDLLPFLEMEEEAPDNGVIPIEEGDRFPIYSIEATGSVEATPALLHD
jgi:tetratricopeptide (TPR) repeat protein